MIFTYITNIDNTIKKYFNPINEQNWFKNKHLARACRGGNMDIVKLMIEKGANHWNWGLRCACRGGHMDIVKLMIEKGADDWNWGLWGACEGGHMDIVKLMIEKGANKCYNCNKSLKEHL